MDSWKIHVSVECFYGVKGILRTITMGLGLLCVIMVSIFRNKNLENNFSPAGWEETFLLFMVITSFILSLILTIMFLIFFEYLNVSGQKQKNIDIYFHLIAGVLLFLAAILFAANVIDNEVQCTQFCNSFLPAQIRPYSRCRQPELPGRIVSVLFGIALAMIYLVLGYLLIKTESYFIAFMSNLKHSESKENKKVHRKPASDVEEAGL